MLREGGAGSRVQADTHEETTQQRDYSVPITQGRTPGTSRDSQVWARNQPPKCAMGDGGWCKYGASGEHQQALRLLTCGQLLPVLGGGLEGGRRECISVGAMAEGEQRRRRRGAVVAWEVVLAYGRMPPVPSRMPFP